MQWIQKCSTCIQTVSSGTLWIQHHSINWPADEAAVGDTKLWLKEQDNVEVTLWNEAIISVTPPNHVVLEVTQTDPGIRGDTAQGATKPATVETGATIMVPLFVDNGDLLRIDTRTGKYISRAKDE